VEKSSFCEGKTLSGTVAALFAHSGGYEEEAKRGSHRNNWGARKLAKKRNQVEKTEYIGSGYRNGNHRLRKLALVEKPTGNGT